MKLGTRYPSRTFFVNPPPASGRLSTVPPPDNENASLENVNVTSSVGNEANDYWTDGANRNKSTRFVVYEPRYSNYREAPATRYESGITFNRFSNGANLTLTDQRVVEDDRITLVAVSGDLRRNGVSTVSVDPEAVSTISRRERVSGELNVTIPTTLNATRWDELLSDEIDDGWVNDTHQTGPNRVTIELNDSRTYSLGIAAVHLGSGDAPDRSAAYLDVEQRPSQMTEGTTREVVLEVRDQFGNPVSGKAVTGYAPEGSFVGGTTATVRTDDDGRAVFEYTAGGDDAALNFTFVDGKNPGDSGFDASMPENANITVDISAPTAGTGGSGSPLAVVGTATAFDADGDSTPGGVSLTVRNTGNTSVDITAVTVIPEDIRFNGLSDEIAGEGKEQSELYVESSTQSGYVDVELTPDQYTYVSGRGRSLSLIEPRTERALNTNTGGLEDVSTVVGSGMVEVRGQTNTTVEFAEFYLVGENSATEQNMSDRDVRIVVAYMSNDGAKRTAEFLVHTAPPGSAGGGGGSGSGSSQTSFTGTSVTDNTGSNGKQTDFDISYSVNNTDFENVTITVVNSDSGVQEGQYTSVAQSDTYSFNDDNSNKQTYDIVFRIYASDGTIEDEVTITEKSGAG
ncbi:hypothetical protein [Halobaculum halobium]|uniref:hypothetical protein n=1 Tax=Halobaculum halobium TaxID=3032281 RepID=UPI0036F2FFC6